MEEYLGNKSNITNENGYYCYDTIQQFNRPIKFYDNDTLITHQKNVTSFDGEQYHIVLEKGFYDYCLKGNREALEELSENLIAMNSFKVNFKRIFRVFVYMLILAIPYGIMSQIMIYPLFFEQQKELLSRIGLNHRNIIMF